MSVAKGEFRVSAFELSTDFKTVIQGTYNDIRFQNPTKSEHMLLNAVPDETRSPMDMKSRIMKSDKHNLSFAQL